MKNLIKLATILFVLIVPMGNSLFAQNVTNEEIKDFFVSIGEIQDGDRCSYYAYELLTSDTLQRSEVCGIYRIGMHASHSYTYLLLLDKQDKVFLNCHTDLYQTLKSIFAFWNKNNCNFAESKKLSYIKAVMNVYYQNEKVVPW